MREAEKPAAMELVWRVSQRFKAPEYSPESIRTFRSYITDRSVPSVLTVYGAFDGETVIGVLDIRKGAHISLFFVDTAWYRRGVGKELFRRFLADSGAEAVTVNSSPYAVGVYRRLDFSPIAPEQLTDGIRYTPMAYRRAGA